MYGITCVDTCDNIGVKLFRKSMFQEALQPTTDAVQLHIQRLYYQTMVWIHADVSTQVLPDISTSGWAVDGYILLPEMMRLPHIPDACLEIIACGGCTKECEEM